MTNENNIIGLQKNNRLTEQEVHQAIKDLIDSGENVSSLSLLRNLGRGSLTTITKYLSSFNEINHPEEPYSSNKLSELPDNLGRSARLMAIKIWNEAQIVANQELENQRNILEQAAKISTEKIHEAEIFSEEQAKRLEEQENISHETILDLKKTIEKLTLDMETKSTACNQTITELEVIKNKFTDLSDTYEQNKVKLLELNQLKEDNKMLDLQISKQQVGLDILNKQLDNERGLRKSESDETKQLIEKAAILEGELKAWKNFKPKE